MNKNEVSQRVLKDALEDYTDFEEVDIENIIHGSEYSYG